MGAGVLVRAEIAMLATRLSAAILGLFVLSAAPAGAQEEYVPSQCLAVAQSLPNVVYANFRPAGSATVEEVKITYAGHSTYVIETPGGVRIATDFNGWHGADPVPRVVTMNKAHSTHHTLSPDPRIEHVLEGWNPEGDGPARHAVTIDDVYIRNVPTDIRRYGIMEENGNSIFIFEVADLCIGHLGHLHHHLENEHYAAIGRLDVVMVPVDGGMTLSLATLSEITGRLQSSIVLPMHRHSTPIEEFLHLMGGKFAVDFSGERSFKVSLATLPRRPTILVLSGV
jgi:L-ascorbate metabolism protein UlaG (beta-lactamase superfamily)